MRSTCAASINRPYWSGTLREITRVTLWYKSFNPERVSGQEGGRLKASFHGANPLGPSGVVSSGFLQKQSETNGSLSGCAAIDKIEAKESVSIYSTFFYIWICKCFLARQCSITPMTLDGLVLLWLSESLLIGLVWVLLKWKVNEQESKLLCFIPRQWLSRGSKGITVA